MARRYEDLPTHPSIVGYLFRTLASWRSGHAANAAESERSCARVRKCDARGGFSPRLPSEQVERAMPARGRPNMARIRSFLTYAALPGLCGIARAGSLEP